MKERTLFEQIIIEQNESLQLIIMLERALHYIDRDSENYVKAMTFISQLQMTVEQCDQQLKRLQTDLKDEQI